MIEKLDEKIQLLAHALHEEGLVIKGIRNGIRIKFETGANIDIYALRSDPSHIRARLKLFNTDENSCSDTLEDITSQLRKGFGDQATMENFRLTKNEDQILSFYARITMGNEPEAVLPGLESRIEDKETATDNCSMPNDSEIAVELLETVDSKMFRQAIDDLGLARSSFLRVVLTRIFRAAADPDELTTVIEEEAERITDPHDLMELKQISLINATDFLEPVLKLLNQYASGDSDLKMVLE